MLGGKYTILLCRWPAFISLFRYFFQWNCFLVALFTKLSHAKNIFFVLDRNFYCIFIKFLTLQCALSFWNGDIWLVYCLLQPLQINGIPVLTSSCFYIICWKADLLCLVFTDTLIESMVKIEAINISTMSTLHVSTHWYNTINYSL